MFAPASLAKGKAKSKPNPPSLQEQLDDLKQQIAILERKIEVDKELQAGVDAKITATVNAGPDGFSLNSKDGKFKLRVRALLQSDGRFFSGGKRTAGIDTYSIRRAFLPVTATLGKTEFLIQPDFGRGTVTVLDAYGEVKLRPGLAIRAGKFKAPVSLERLRSSSADTFAEGSFVTGLTPNRDIGIQLSGAPGGGEFSWQLATLNGTADAGSSDADNANPKALVARLWFEPFKNTGDPNLGGLGFGLAYTQGNQHGGPGAAANLPTYRTSNGQEVFFRYKNSANTTPLTVSAWADGNGIRYVPQLFYTRGPLAVLAELASSKQQIRTGHPSGVGTVENNLTNKAWSIGTSYVLTGEDNTYKGVIYTSSKILDGNPTGTSGAWELKARLDHQDIDSKTYPLYASTTTAAREANGLTLGVNGYLSRSLKLYLDWEKTAFKGGGGGTAAAPLNRKSESAFVLRTQLSF